MCGRVGARCRDPVSRAADQSVTEKTRHSPGTPRSSCTPRSANSSPEPPVTGRDDLLGGSATDTAPSRQLVRVIWVDAPGRRSTGSATARHPRASCREIRRTGRALDTQRTATRSHPERSSGARIHCRVWDWPCWSPRKAFTAEVKALGSSMKGACPPSTQISFEFGNAPRRLSAVAVPWIDSRQ